MPKISESIHIADAALALFRLHVERHGQVEVDNATRPLYRELREPESWSPGIPSPGARRASIM